MRKLLIITLTLLNSVWAISQDVRSLETKIADLLARMPVYDQEDIVDHMNQMAEIGKVGWDKICSGIVEPGTGDDTRSRFLVESFSRYISTGDNTDLILEWEAQCISYIEKSENLDARRFFFNQLQITGTSISSDYSLKYIDNPDLAESALAVISVVADDGSELIMAKKLKDHSISTASSIMNTLSTIKSDIAIDDYIYWFDNGNSEEKRAALKALALSGHDGAFKTLAKAAKSVDYSWESTGATEAYLSYASELLLAGNIKSSKKICNEVVKKTNDHSIQYKSYALTLLTELSGANAPQVLADNFSHKNYQYRKHALELAKNLPGEAATTIYLTKLSETDPEFVPDIMHMLGDRLDNSAAQAILPYVNHIDADIRMAALVAFSSLEGVSAADEIITYIKSYADLEEQEKAFSLYSTIADPERLELIANSYPSLGGISKAFSLMLLAEGGNNKYLKLLLSETFSNDDLVRNAAYVSLKELATKEDIPALLDLLSKTIDKGEILQVQLALASSANKDQEIETRTDLLIEAAGKQELKVKVIPVLSRVGGSLALSLVLDNFHNGDQAMKELCFDALAGWKDYSASYALFDICKSGNNNYLRPAFEGYVRQLTNANISSEQKLLLMRKIMPFAESPDQKVLVLHSISDIHTLPALFFAEKYFDDNVINQVATRSAIQIALPANSGKVGLYGENVRKSLNRVIKIIKGEGSEYEIERIKKYLSDMPDNEGFLPMFNGEDLSGWQGLVENPISRSKMSDAELARKQKEADSKMVDNWSVHDNSIWFSGKGANLCSVKEYADFEMLVDWRITKEGDSGIYLRGSPQIQIWDTSRVEVGAQVGSGGLYNNAVNKSHPLKVSDNPVGDWNSFRIIMIGERVSVWLNGDIVVDDVIMENYWDRSIPIFPKGAIELQAHGNELAFRDIYVREIKKEEYNLTEKEKIEGFVALFNGSNLDNWLGDKESYIVDNGTIAVMPDGGSGGNLFTEREYSNFNFRFEFKLTEGANNGLGIRAPLEGDAAYLGMELQILDNRADIYAELEPYQYHGSVYGVIPAKRGFLRPIDEWNSEEVIVDGTHITVILNGEIIVDGDIADARDNGTMDHRDHPGLKRDKGHIGYLGHGHHVRFRNIRIKELD